MKWFVTSINRNSSYDKNFEDLNLEDSHRRHVYNR
jgi:hypothetical protein